MEFHKGLMLHGLVHCLRLSRLLCVYLALLQDWPHYVAAGGCFEISCVGKVELEPGAFSELRMGPQMPQVGLFPGAHLLLFQCLVE
jgi:hypothetical protein